MINDGNIVKNEETGSSYLIETEEIKDDVSYAKKYPGRTTRKYNDKIYKEMNIDCPAELKKLRKSTGLRVAAFAEYYHIPYKTYMKWESGENLMPVYMFLLLKRAVSEDFPESSESDRQNDNTDK